jgi:hypothetical protein
MPGVCANFTHPGQIRAILNPVNPVKRPCLSAGKISVSHSQYQWISVNITIEYLFVLRNARIPAKPGEIRPKLDDDRERTQRTHGWEVKLSASFVIFPARHNLGGGCVLSWPIRPIRVAVAPIHGCGDLR